MRWFHFRGIRRNFAGFSLYNSAEFRGIQCWLICIQSIYPIFLQFFISGSLVSGSGSGLRIRIRILAGRDEMVLHKKEVMIKIHVVELSKGLEASPGAWTIFQRFKKKKIRRFSQFSYAVQYTYRHTEHMEVENKNGIPVSYEDTLSRYCNSFAFPPKKEEFTVNSNTETVLLIPLFLLFSNQK
jgi:hypothetical protein